MSNSISPALNIGYKVSANEGNILGLLTFARGRQSRIQSLRSITNTLYADPKAGRRACITNIIDGNSKAYFLARSARASLANNNNRTKRKCPYILACSPPRLRSDDDIVYLGSRNNRFVGVSRNIAKALQSRVTNRPPLMLRSGRSRTAIESSNVYAALPTSVKVNKKCIPVMCRGRKVSSECANPCSISPAVSTETNAKKGGLPLIRRRAFYVIKGIVSERPRGNNGKYKCRGSLTCALAKVSERTICDERHASVFGRGSIIDARDTERRGSTASLVMRPCRRAMKAVKCDSRRKVGGRCIKRSGYIIRKPGLVHHLAPLRYRHLRNFPSC